MAENTNSIFRKKSLEKVSSPEQLNEYIRVANPGVWMVLLAVVVFFGGMIVWGVFGRLETTVAGAAVLEDSGAVLYIPETAAGAVRPGQTVRVGDAEFAVESVDAEPVELDESFDSLLLHAGGFHAGDWAYRAELSGSVDETGIFGGEVVTDSVSPMSFVVN